MAKQAKQYKVIALSVSGKNVVYNAGDIVDQNKLNAPAEKLVEAGFLEPIEAKAAPKKAAEKKAPTKK